MLKFDTSPPYPGFEIGIALALLLGGSGSLWVMRREGLSGRQSLFALATLAAALLVGSKLLYVAGLWWQGVLDASWFPGVLYSRALRLPGGILLAVAIGPFLARRLGLPFLHAADAIVPVTGLTIVGVRVGCFLKGCCFGHPSELPWAVSFPRWTEAHLFHVSSHLIPITAEGSLAVQPLQLYFGLAGLLTFAGLAAYSRHKRYDGELLLLFGIAYLWSTWLLEFLRATPHPVTQQIVLGAALLATATWIVVESRRWMALARPARVTSAEGTT